MTAIDSGAQALADTLLAALTYGVNFEVPTVDLTDANLQVPGTSGPLYTDINPLTIADLTTGVVGGTGVFDKLMESLTAHLKVEYAANRISGAEYTKAYLGVVTAALGASTQFLLTRDQTYWQSLLVQAQAKAADIEIVTARVGLETARVQLARTQFEALTAEVNYSLIKMKIATEDATYANMAAQTTGIEYTNANLLPKQVTLLSEQTEVQRAQTMDNRTDGQTVSGVMGKQKVLYQQQVDSYKRDAETKVAKIYSDAWITQKTIDEGIIAPTQFTNTNIDAVLSKIRTSNGLT